MRPFCSGKLTGWQPWTWISCSKVDASKVLVSLKRPPGQSWEVTDRQMTESDMLTDAKSPRPLPHDDNQRELNGQTRELLDGHRDAFRLGLDRNESESRTWQGLEGWHVRFRTSS
jgi:hypothetical protein